MQTYLFNLSVFKQICLLQAKGLVSHSEFSLPLSGPQQYCLAQEVPRTSEALRLHRNTLTMELVWLQQAIDSRKKVRQKREEM